MNANELITDALEALRSELNVGWGGDIPDRLREAIIALERGEITEDVIALVRSASSNQSDVALLQIDSGWHQGSPCSKEMRESSDRRAQVANRYESLANELEEILLAQ